MPLGLLVSLNTSTTASLVRHWPLRLVEGRVASPGLGENAGSGPASSREVLVHVTNTPYSSGGGGRITQMSDFCCFLLLQAGS
jgi:hypothetical protein